MEETAKKYYVYFLKSLKDGSYYIGVSDNYVRRLKEHNSSLSKSTRFKKPWQLVRLEEFNNINSVYRREKFLKAKKSRKIIEKIINSNN